MEEKNNVNNEIIMDKEELKVEVEEMGVERNIKMEVISAYEDIINIHDDERIIDQDYEGNYYVKSNANEKMIDEAYKKSLSKIGIKENEFYPLNDESKYTKRFIQNYYLRKTLKEGDVISFRDGQKARLIYDYNINVDKEFENEYDKYAPLYVLKLSNGQPFETYIDDIKRICEPLNELEQAEVNYKVEIYNLRESLNHAIQSTLTDEDFNLVYNKEYIEIEKRLKQVENEYEEFKSTLLNEKGFKEHFSEKNAISDKEHFQIKSEVDLTESLKYKYDTEKVMEGKKELLNERNIIEDFIAILDKKTGNYLQISAELEKEKDELKIGIEKKPESELDKILKELITRKDIKGLKVNIHINDTIEVYNTNEELNISVEDAVNKIKNTVKNFEDVVIVFSKKELELLQKQYREDNGIEEVKNEAENESTESKSNIKSYSSIKAEFIEQIINNESMSKGYIRISEDDFSKLGDALDKYEIPYLDRISEFKEGVNIIVPIDKMDKLKDILSENDIKCMQIVHGNIDWKNIKGTKNTCAGVTKEELKKFQGLNNDKYNYIAFENEKGFSVYMQEECDIKIKIEQPEKQDKAKNNSSSRKEAHQIKQDDDINKKKTVAEVKTEVENIKKNDNSLQSSNEKIKVEKER